MKFTLIYIRGNTKCILTTTRDGYPDIHILNDFVESKIATTWNKRFYP